MFKMLTTILLLGLLPVHALQAETRTADAIIDEVCKHCHGSDGQASNVEYPRLAGQHKAYLIKQLQNFRSGKRIGTMNEMASGLDDNEIIALADFFSQQQPESHRVRNKALAAVGEYIFHEGNKYSGVTACKSCHGEDGGGTTVLPRLAGQHKRYVSTQLEDFGSRQRTNDNAIMHSVASKLTELEREAVALYVSGLP